MSAVSMMMIRPLMLVALGLTALSAHAQGTASVTQQFLNAPLGNPVLAVELDAAPHRALPQHTPATASGASAGRPGLSYSAQDHYGSRLSSQASPAMYTGAGVAASSGGLADTIRAYDSTRPVR